MQATTQVEHVQPLEVLQLIKDPLDQWRAEQEAYSEAIVPYRPFTSCLQSQQVLQRVEQVANTIGQFGKSAAAHSLVVVQYSGQQAAAYAVVASRAVTRILHHVAEHSRSVGCNTSLALYHGASKSWVLFVQQLGIAQHSVISGQQAVAVGLKTFGHDVAEASRIMLRDAPAVVGRMRQDVGSAAESANHAVKQLCHAVSHKLTAASQQVRFLLPSCLIERC